jgi:hypothetical protein
MKSNKEILEYLKPYTEMQGVFLQNKIVVYERFYDYMVVKIDGKASWKGVDNSDSRGNSIKTYLRSQGFIYNSFLDGYTRPYYKKDWPKEKRRETAKEKYERTLRMMKINL